VETDTLNALNTLIAQGQAKPVTAVAPVDTAPVVLAAATDDNETATTILRKTLEFYGLDEPDLVRRNPHSPSQPTHHRLINSRRNRHPTT
jgi:hypothetical protein